MMRKDVSVRCVLQAADGSGAEDELRRHDDFRGRASVKASTRDVAARWHCCQLIRVSAQPDNRQQPGEE